MILELNYCIMLLAVYDVRQIYIVFSDSCWPFLDAHATDVVVLAWLHDPSVPDEAPASALASSV